MKYDSVGGRSRRLIDLVVVIVAVFLIQIVLHVKTLIDSVAGPALSTALTFTLYIVLIILRNP